MNMFAYCCNDPINLLDEDGCISKFWKRFIVIAAAIVVVAAVVAVTVASGGLAGPRNAALNKRAQIEKRYSEGGYRTQHNYEFGKQSNAARINRATIVLKNRSYQNLLRDFISSLEINTYQSILFS